MASNNSSTSSSSPFAAGLAGLQELANRANSSSAQKQSSSNYPNNNNRYNNNDRGGYRPHHHHRGGGGGGRNRKRHYESGRDSGGRDYRRPRHSDETDHYTQLTARLRQSNYQVNLFRPLLPPSEPQPQRPFHLALLVLSIDDLPYEHIWKAWATSTAPTSSSSSSLSQPRPQPRLLVSLLCHAKFPDQVQSDFLRQRLLLKPPKYMKGRGNNILELQPPEYLTHRPEWGSIEITRAMIDLLREGLRIDGSSSTGKAGEAAYSTRRYLIQDDQDNACQPNLESIPPVDKFVFISETCLPVTTLEETRVALFGEDEATPSPSEAAPENDTPITGEDALPGVDEPSTLAVTNNSPEPSQSPTAPSATTAPPPSAVANFNLLNMSWVNARNFKTPGTPKNMYERDQFQGIGSSIPHCFRYKADQWLVLSRPHSRVIVDLDRQLRPRDNPFWTLFSRINASDEMYMPTALAVLGILQDEELAPPASEPQQDAVPVSPPAVSTATSTSTSTTSSTSIQVKRAPVTYTDWSEGMRNPALFTKGVVDFQRVARIAREKGCLFARKFAPFLPVPGGTSNNKLRETNGNSVPGYLSVEEWSTSLRDLGKPAK